MPDISGDSPELEEDAEMLDNRRGDTIKATFRDLPQTYISGDERDE